MFATTLNGVETSCATAETICPAFDDALTRDVANDVDETDRPAFGVDNAADAQVERAVARAVERLDLNHALVFGHLRVGTAPALVQHRVTGVPDHIIRGAIEEAQHGVVGLRDAAYRVSHNDRVADRVESGGQQGVRAARSDEHLPLPAQRLFEQRGALREVIVVCDR
jgi:hypothetical protein